MFVFLIEILEEGSNGEGIANVEVNSGDGVFVFY